MGWTEREYLESSPESVHYAFQGYFDKRGMDEKVMRNVGFIIYKVNGGKMDDPSQIWPIAGEKPKERKRFTWGTKEEAEDMMQKIMAAHKININGRNQNTDKR